MSHLLAVVRHQHDSALSRDVAINTFHFDTSGTLSVAAEAARDLLLDFYRVAPPSPAIGSLASYMSELLLEDGMEMRFYDMDSAPPRVPLDPPSGTYSRITGSGALPSEVALCMSFQGAVVGGTNRARRRGRIYFGPLDVASSNGDGVPTDALRNTLVGAGARLTVDSQLTNAVWSVYSPTDDALVHVDNGWVDNAFDTQRRRGEAPTVRTPWSP
jgi:hypothetical protein